ncbi:hypothetical protein JTE90_022468 [Oedothorax gibbosus]|uniref:FLYWCH-type domain-containing protein n=1 Tax=Oedothorax gibbosus TaxID=931172 RepID=A0AAV6TVM7_9ARAC|nr:hypothetical protein JTE90_022468 [Oedothorax gibbosus]
MALVFVKNNKGGNHLVYKSYKFRQENKELNLDGLPKYCRCSSYDSTRCPARIILQSQSDVSETNLAHNHSAKPSKRKAEEVRQQILKKAKSSTEVPQAILASLFGGISEEVAGALPSTDSLAREIRRERQKCGSAPPNFKFLKNSQN